MTSSRVSPSQLFSKATFLCQKLRDLALRSTTTSANSICWSPAISSRRRNGTRIAATIGGGAETRSTKVTRLKDLQNRQLPRSPLLVDRGVFGQYAMESIHGSLLARIKRADPLNFSLLPIEVEAPV